MKKQKGYIALASMLVIAAVVALIGTTVTLTSINGLQTSFSLYRADSSLDLVEGCAEDALFYLNEINALPVTIILPVGSCSIDLESQSGNDWTFIVNGNFSGYTKKVRIQTNRSTTISVTSWQEM